MGMSVTQLLIILAIVIVLFGTKRLRNLGGDLGGAIKGFRSALKDGNESKKMTEEESQRMDNDEIVQEQDKAEK